MSHSKICCISIGYGVLPYPLNGYEFLSAIARNGEYASKDIANANFDMLEYDRMTQQGTNDSVSIKERVRILSEFLGITE